MGNDQNNQFNNQNQWQPQNQNNPQWNNNPQFNNGSPQWNYNNQQWSNGNPQWNGQQQMYNQKPKHTLRNIAIGILIAMLVFVMASIALVAFIFSQYISKKASYSQDNIKINTSNELSYDDETNTDGLKYYVSNQTLKSLAKKYNCEISQVTSSTDTEYGKYDIMEWWKLMADDASFYISTGNEATEEYAVKRFTTTLDQCKDDSLFYEVNSGTVIGDGYFTDYTFYYNNYVYKYGRSILKGGTIFQIEGNDLDLINEIVSELGLD